MAKPENEFSLVANHIILNWDQFVDEVFTELEDVEQSVLKVI